MSLTASWIPRMTAEPSGVQVMPFGRLTVTGRSASFRTVRAPQARLSTWRRGRSREPKRRRPCLAIAPDGGAFALRHRSATVGRVISCGAGIPNIQHSFHRFSARFPSTRPHSGRLVPSLIGWEWPKGTRAELSGDTLRHSAPIQDRRYSSRCIALSLRRVRIAPHNV